MLKILSDRIEKETSNPDKNGLIKARVSAQVKDQSLENYLRHLDLQRGSVQVLHDDGLDPLLRDPTDVGTNHRLQNQDTTYSTSYYIKV